jgi:ATP-dependent DNA ligase
LRSRQGQAEAILVAYDVMEVDGQDVRPEALEERRNRLAKLLSRKTKAMRDGIQVSEAITGDGLPSFVMRCLCRKPHPMEVGRESRKLIG